MTEKTITIQQHVSQNFNSYVEYLYSVFEETDVAAPPSPALKTYKNTYKDFPLVQDVYRHLLDYFSGLTEAVYFLQSAPLSERRSFTVALQVHDRWCSLIHCLSLV